MGLTRRLCKPDCTAYEGTLGVGAGEGGRRTKVEGLEGSERSEGFVGDVGNGIVANIQDLQGNATIHPCRRAMCEVNLPGKALHGRQRADTP